jgi:hypothetical protein
MSGFESEFLRKALPDGGASVEAWSICHHEDKDVTLIRVNSDFIDGTGCILGKTIEFEDYCAICSDWAINRSKAYKRLLFESELETLVFSWILEERKII